MTLGSGVLANDMQYVVERYGNLEAFEDKTILITGFAGFLGYYFTHFFLNALDRGVGIKSLVLMDNFERKKPRWISELPAGNGKIQIHTFDVAKDQLADVNLTQEPDYIVHMASIASPMHYRRRPVETLDANVWGLRTLLDYSKTLALDGLLFFSSSEIYGDPVPEAMPTGEEYRGNVSCIGPRACYDEAKRFGETLCYVFAHCYNMPISIVRPFNNFGPGMSLDDRRAPADFARAVVQHQDIVLHSDGSPTRTFCYVADAIVGYLKALTHNQFDYFNIGSDHPEISVREFAQMFQRVGKGVMGYDGNVTFEQSSDREYLTDNPHRRRPDISKARQLLGFEPTIHVEDGIRRFLQHLMEESTA